MAPKISIIIVTYNSVSTIEDCLLSIQRQTLKEFDVIIVDNSSRDDTTRVVESLGPQLSYRLATFFLDTNLGFAGGNNYAFQHAAGDYIGLLNPDAVAESTWLEELARVLDTEPSVGLCASKMIAHGTTIIDSAGDGWSSWLKGFKRGEGEDQKKFTKQEYVFGACAGAALYRKAMLDEIGFLDEAFFLLQEDTDLNFRAQLAGWKALFVPSAVVHHKVRSSIGDMSDTAVYYSLRNIELVRMKNVPAALLLGYSPLLVAYAVMEFAYFAVRHRRPLLYVRAKVGALKMLPRVLKKRSAILRSRKASNRELVALFTSVFDRQFLVAKTRRLLFD